jgi:hypothetical protein
MSPSAETGKQAALLAALTKNRGELDAETLRRLLLGLRPKQARPSRV